MRDEGTQTENTLCEERVWAEGESQLVQARLSRNTIPRWRQHTSAISYLRKRLGKWGVESKLLHDFRSAEEEEESRYFFLFSPKERRRVVAPKGLSNALFYFGEGRCNRSSMLRYVENRAQGRRRGKSKRFLPFSFVVPSFTSVPSRFTGRQWQAAVAERRRNRSVAIRMCVFLDKLSSGVSMRSL